MTEANVYSGFLSAAGIAVKASAVMATGVEVLSIEAKDLLTAAGKLKKDKAMALNFITALEVKSGYQAAYYFSNITNGDAVELKVTVPKADPTIASLSDLFASANWQEREAYDMIGLNFEGHPNLTRILNPDNWDGHPLRKDYIGPIDALNQPVNI